MAPQYVNNPLPFDVTFVVEGRNLHAHRATLRASSDTFRAMFDGPYRDSRAAIIHIPNMRYVILEAMMRYIYTGADIRILGSETRMVSMLLWVHRPRKLGIRPGWSFMEIQVNGSSTPLSCQQMLICQEHCTLRIKLMCQAQ